MTTEAFPARLTRLRTARGLTKEQLGHAIGVSDMAIGHWERGERIPSAANLEMLAGVLCVTMQDLWLGETGRIDSRRRSTRYVTRPVPKPAPITQHEMVARIEAVRGRGHVDPE